MPDFRGIKDKKRIGARYANQKNFYAIYNYTIQDTKDFGI